MLRISGLSVTGLRVHDGPLRSLFATLSSQAGVLPLVMARDPHQKMISAKRAPGGEEALDRVSGR